MVCNVELLIQSICKNEMIRNSLLVARGNTILSDAVIEGKNGNHASRREGGFLTPLSILPAGLNP